MLKIEFDTDNAAYHFDGEEDDVDPEAVAETLREVARKVADGAPFGNVRDANGNRVGHWTLNASA